MFLVLAHYSIATGNHAAVLDLVTELAQESRLEDGCLGFDSYVNTDDDSELILVERYETSDDFAAHRESTVYQELVVEQIIPLLSERRVESYTVPD